MKPQSNFLLSKWYLDCVSDCGELFIAYVASLSWQGLSINYSSILNRQSNGQITTSTSLRDSSVPRQTGETIAWHSSQLEVNGSWQALAAPVHRVLLESEAGSLDWNCLQPKATVVIDRCKGQQLEGLGYVEHLTMSLPPWQLPFAELRWGRFLSSDEALVWIDWRGLQPLKLALDNGNQISEVVITDHGLETSEIDLALTESAVIREGPLIKTALSTIPGIRRLFPLRVLRTHECKWLSRGTLKRNSGATGNGWAIHEVVRWE